MTEREVLTEFYRHTFGRKWNRNTNWLSELRAGKWYGLEVDISGHIISINLNDNQLVGVLDYDENFISKLYELKRLHLMSNSLSGSIPTAIRNLKSLTELNLAWNLLTGYKNIFLEFHGLHKIMFENLRIGTIPDSLYELTELTILNLGHNNLSGTLSDSLKNLTNLQFLNLRSNKLSGR